MHDRRRLDQWLVDHGLAESRTQAQRLILAGQVRVNGHPSTKPGTALREDARVEVITGERYVSRGGTKLEHALNHFAIDPHDTTALDLGASTGGFTDCLLQHGARRVAAVDVGRGQLAWKLRNDSRVLVMERTNARSLKPELFPTGWAPFDLVVADCSFISLRLVLPVADPLVRERGNIIALVKPQFEAGKAEADRGAGVITDPEVHARVLRELEAFVRGRLPSLEWCGVTESPLLGPAGNKEFLALLRKDSKRSAVPS